MIFSPVIMLLSPGLRHHPSFVYGAQDRVQDVHFIAGGVGVCTEPAVTEGAARSQQRLTAGGAGAGGGVLRVELSAMARDFFGLRLADSRCEAQVPAVRILYKG